MIQPKNRYLISEWVFLKSLLSTNGDEYADAKLWTYYNSFQHNYSCDDFIFSPFSQYPPFGTLEGIVKHPLVISLKVYNGFFVSIVDMVRLFEMTIVINAASNV